MDLVCDIDGKNRRDYWKQTVEPLRAINSNLLFEDWIEENISFKKTRPWTGILHFPPRKGEFYSRDHQKLFSSPEWLESADNLKVVFTLSEYLAEHVRKYLSIPVVSALHPMPDTDQKFSEKNFAMNQNRMIYQLGWHFKNTHAINQLPIIPGYQKARPRPALKLAETNERITIAYWKKHGWRKDYGHVHQVNPGIYLTVGYYEKVLTENVMFMEVFDASASKAILECMVRNTPVVVNRHPALEEYLGKDYPLFYDSFEEAPSRFSVEKVLQGHHYLCNMNKHHISPEAFQMRLRGVISD